MAFLWGIPTGILFSTSYPPFPAWALFFAFAPLWVYWFKTERLRNVFISGFVAQFLFTFIGFNWIAHTATEYGHLPLILSVLVLIGFCLFASLNLVLAGILAKLLQTRWPSQPLLFFMLVASLCGLCDWVYPMIFPWNTGYPLYFSHLSSAQLGEFVGFQILGTLVYLANALFAFSYYSFPKKGWSLPLMVFVAGLFVTESLGHWASNRLPPDDKQLTALLVQPNIGNYDKFVAERGNGYQAPVVEKFLAQAQAGLQKAIQENKKPDLMIFPETSYPASLDPYFADSFYTKQLTDFIDHSEIPALVGAYSDDPPKINHPKTYNGVFSIEPHKPLSMGYRKHLLLAFGEYFPGSDFFPFLKTLIPEISDFGRGDGPVVFNLGGAALTPLICYEGLDTSYVAEAMKLGGQIFVNVTNDSWFGKNFEPYQHMIMTVARSIEYRRPMIRVTNTGLTTVVDAKGNILLTGPQDEPWSGIAQVPYASHAQTTVFSKIEPYVTVLLLALVGAIFILGAPLMNRELDWPELLNQIAKLSSSARGAARCLAIAPLRNGSSAQTKAQNIIEAGAAIHENAIPNLSVLDLIPKPLERLSRQAVLDVKELSDVRQFLYASTSLKDLLRESKSSWTDLITSQIADFKSQLSAINHVLSPEGEINESASALLSSLCEERRRLSREISRTLDQIVASRKMEPVLQDKYVTNREGRMVIPVKSGNQHDVKGLIHDSSQTKQTVFMEPEEVVPINNRLREVQILIQEEIARILKELSQYLSRFHVAFTNADNAPS